MPRSPEGDTRVFCPQLITRFSLACQRFNSLCLSKPANTATFSSFLSIILFICLSSVIVDAQSTTATLTGIVKDQSEAVIPGVKISVISIANGFQRDTVTDQAGTFTVPLLSPGTYTVKADRVGFSPTEVRNIVLNVSDVKEILLYLKVGEISQTVEIVDGSNLRNQSPVVSTVIDQQFLQNLPAPGRSFQQLIALTPGTVMTATSATEFGQFSVNGQRADTNYATIDGVSANVSATYSTGTAFSQNNSGSVLGFSAMGTTSNLVSIDAMQEFKVLTSSFAPEFGRTPGAQVLIITRSGENKFHGSIFEYFRNDVLDANDWFANSRGQKRAALRQNIFGGTLSGPILLPRFGEGGKQPWFDGHNRTFFFFSYEGQRLLLPRFGITDVPSLAARTSVTQPAIKELLDAFPLPTGPTKAGNFAEFAASYSDPSTLDATSIRVDHVASPKLLLFGRYSNSPSESLTRGNGFSLNTVNRITNGTQTLTFGATSPLSATISNEFRANWSRARGSQAYAVDEFGGAVAPPFSFFVSPQFETPRSGGLINLNPTNFASLRTGALADNLQRQLNFTENLSVAYSSHQMKFGADFRRLLPVVGSSDYTVNVNFAGVNGALTGRTSQVAITVTTPLEPIYDNFSVFAQDSWKINKRLMLTYGLRWDVNPAPHEKNGNNPAVIVGFDNLSTASLTFGPPLYKTTYNNFAPRVGAAYQLRENAGRELILRGGFGTFYDIGNQTTGGAFANGFPYTATARPPAPFFPLTPAQLTPPVPSRTLPPIAGTAGVFLFDPNLQLPRVYQWNLALEQSLGSNQTFSLTYIGAAGRKLLQQQMNSGTVLKNANFRSITVTRNTATSDYHSMQLQFQRRLSRGLQILASHSWSHSIDIASRDSATVETFPGLPPEIDRGSSDFDLRHSFRLAATYELPKLKGGILTKTLLHQWAFDAIYTAQSGSPVDVTYFRSPAFNALTIQARPDLIEGVPLYVDDPTVAGGQRINRAAFSIPTTDRPGSLGRNILLGTPVSQLDFVVRRSFKLSERARLNFRTEFYNLFNHPNFARPSSLLGTLDFGTLIPNSNFGRPVTMLNRGLGGSQTSGLNALYQIGGPRSIQFSLRLDY